MLRSERGTDADPDGTSRGFPDEVAGNVGADAEIGGHVSTPPPQSPARVRATPRLFQAFARRFACAAGTHSLTRFGSIRAGRSRAVRLTEAGWSRGAARDTPRAMTSATRISLLSADRRGADRRAGRRRRSLAPDRGSAPPTSVIATSRRFPLAAPSGLSRETNPWKVSGPLVRASRCTSEGRSDDRSTCTRRPSPSPEPTRGSR